MYQAKILHKQGIKKCEIAKILEVDRRTVYNYLNDKVFDEKGPSCGRPRGSVKLGPYIDFIEQKLDNDLYVSTELVYNKLLEMGYTGKTTILGDHMKKRRDELMAFAVYRFETIAGHQAQVDWTECGYVWEGGMRRKRYCFVMKLGYSRRSYMEFTISMTQPILFACMKRAFAYFGGVPFEILFDNMKTAFLFDESECRWAAHPKMLAFAAHYGFTPRRCRVRRPETKGKVEREIRYLKSSFFPALRFDGLDVESILTDELNDRVLNWLKRVDRKTLTELGQSRLERFDDDLKALQPIADNEFDHRVDEPVCVSREAKIRFDGNVYSVDASYRGKTLKGLHDPDAATLTLYHEGVEIKQINLLPKGAKKEIVDAKDRQSLLQAWYADRERCQKQRHRRVLKKRRKAQENNVVTDPAVYDVVFGTPQHAEGEVAA